LGCRWVQLYSISPVPHNNQEARVTCITSYASSPPLQPASQGSQRILLQQWYCTTLVSTLESFVLHQQAHKLARFAMRAAHASSAWFSAVAYNHCCATE
jgi:hypothetical protein